LSYKSLIKDRYNNKYLMFNKTLIFLVITSLALHEANLKSANGVNVVSKKDIL